MSAATTIIYRHTPERSEARVAKATDPVPEGWIGGEGWHPVGIEEIGRQMRLSAMLEEAEEGETASLATM